MEKTVARHTVSWCNRSIAWTAVGVETGGAPEPTNAIWSYTLDGLTYFGFPFDPVESRMTTRDRALNWLNRHHLIVKREHLVVEPVGSVR